MVLRGDGMGGVQQLQRASFRRADLGAGAGKLQSVVPEWSQQQQQPVAADPAPAESLLARGLPSHEQVLEPKTRGSAQLRGDLSFPQETRVLRLVSDGGGENQSLITRRADLNEFLKKKIVNFFKCFESILKNRISF